jgi:hypothetical protein
MTDDTNEPISRYDDPTPDSTADNTPNASITDDARDDINDDVGDPIEHEDIADDSPVIREPPPIIAESAPSTGTRRRRPQNYEQTGQPAGRGYGCADVITAVFLLGTILVISVTILLLANPFSALNPFPPPRTPVVILVLITHTPTPVPPSETPAPPSFTPSLTPTEIPPSPTITLTPTITNTPVVGGVIPDATNAANPTPLPLYTRSPLPFTVETIDFTANSTPQGCRWQSIAGTVSDLQRRPIKGMLVRITSQNGNIDEFHTSGEQVRFGESGFEVFLGTIPREERYTLVLTGPRGDSVSEPIIVDTRTGCDQNVAIVNFVQNHEY